MRKRFFLTLVALAMFAGSAGVSRAGVSSVQMKIAGYLCGN
ncbi:MAG TPA: hypothetical protein VFF31_25070 [Blastocatellia bacterium]|nr:hypothetical protein [Blastocatellia bacterium]